MTNDISLDLFDLAASAKPTETPTETPPEGENGSQTTAEGDKKYGNVVRTLTEGEDGSGLMTAREFAAYLTVQKVRSAAADADPTTLVVPESAIYAAMRAQRHPLPVVLSGDKALLPVREAEAVWNDRPVRGEGAAATSKRSDADLLKAAAGARTRAAELAARLANLTERATKAQSLQDKYTTWLGDRNLDWAAVDAWERENTSNTSTPDATNDTTNQPANA